jgi:RNA-binding protein
LAPFSKGTKELRDKVRERFFTLRLCASLYLHFAQKNNKKYSFELIPEIRYHPLKKGLLMEQLKGSQRKNLRSQAHHLKPLVIIGRNGINQQVIGSVDLALKDHELIKVKFGEFKDAKKEISAEIAQATKSEVVGIIGNIAILYRQHPQTEKRKIKIS